MRLKRKSIVIALSLLVFSSEAFSDETNSSFEANLDKGNFFGGLGLSANRAQVSQQLSATSYSDLYENSLLVAYGSSGGDAASYDGSNFTFSPEIQLGYVKHFANSRWLWGSKFSYQNVGLTSTDQNIDSIPAEILTRAPVGYSAGPYGTPPDNLTEKINIGSAQTLLNHQFVLMPFIGKSFANSYVYFGVGPALFGTESKINDVTNSITIEGVTYEGASSNYSSSRWIWGGAAQVGMTYYVDSSWFFDLNYTYAISQNYSANYSSSFSDKPDVSAPPPTGTLTGGPGDAVFTNSGTININTSQQIVNQSIALTINKTFW